MLIFSPLGICRSRPPCQYHGLLFQAAWARPQGPDLACFLGVPVLNPSFCTAPVDSAGRGQVLCQARPSWSQISGARGHRFLRSQEDHPAPPSRKCCSVDPPRGDPQPTGLEPLDKHQPPLLLTSHPEVCDTCFLGVHSSLSPWSSPGRQGLLSARGLPPPPGSPGWNCLLSSSFSTSASQALTAPRDLSEPQPPHPQGGIKDRTATSGGRTAEPGMAWAVTTGCQALQTPGQDTEAEKCPNAEAHSWYLWMPGVFLFVDCWCNFC